MRITRKELAGFTIGLALLAAAACSNESVKPPLGGSTSVVDTSGKGNEIDRSDPSATANAFASMYASGNLPGACQLATGGLRDRLGTKCGGQQPWNTTTSFVNSCSTSFHPNTGGSVPAVGFHYETPNGQLDGESDLVAYLVEGDDDVWSVEGAVVYSPSALTCSSASSSSVTTTG